MTLNEHDDSPRSSSGDWPRWLWYLGAAADVADRWLRLPGRAVAAVFRYRRRHPGI